MSEGGDMTHGSLLEVHLFALLCTDQRTAAVVESYDAIEGCSISHLHCVETIRLHTRCLGQRLGIVVDTLQVQPDLRYRQYPLF